MLIEMMKSKLHRITVTEADLNYIGSITLDRDLADAAEMIEGQRVQILNLNNGQRFETYVIHGERKSGQVCLNGPAARRVAVGDVLIVIAYALMDTEEAKQYKPVVVFPETETNRLIPA